MTRDYSDANDSYGISKMTEQSADQDVARTSLRPSVGDIRGNTATGPRSIPTQEEADRIKREP